MKKRNFVAWLLVFAMSFAMPVSAATVSSGDAGAATVSSGDATVSGGDTEEIPPVSDTDLTGKNVNLVMLVDITGSMSWAIDGVKKNLAEFVRYIGTTGANFRISLIDYRDIDTDEPTRVHTYDYSVWSKNVDQVVDDLEALALGWGGDYEECAVDALGYLLDPDTMTFNSDAAKFAIVVTDATYKEDNVHGYGDPETYEGAMAEVIEGLIKQGIKVSVMTTTDCYDEYKELVDKTGGILCDLSGDFAEELMTYAKEIIAATADSEEVVVKRVESIEAKGPAAVKPGFAYEYNVTFTPADATNKGLIWKIDDKSIAQLVYAKGTVCKVLGLKEGKTALTAISKDGGYTSSVEITVTESAEASGAFFSTDTDAIVKAIKNAGIKTVEYSIATEEKVAIAKDDQKEIFGALKGTDTEFAFSVLDSDGVYYKWSFAGSDIVDPTIAVDFNVVIDAENKDAIDLVDKGVDSTVIHFDHHGALPGKAKVEVAIDKAIAASEVYLYYYNPTTGELELVAEKIPVVDGYAILPIEHCSDYVLTAAMLKSIVPSTDDDDDDDEKDDDDAATITAKKTASPKTGDANSVIPYFIMVACGVCCTAWCTRKKYNR